MRFEYYVLHYDFNKQEVEMFNVFNNFYVQEWSEKAIKKYLRAPAKYKKEDYYYNYEIGCVNKQTKYGFEALCDDIRSIFMSQLWSRVQYEISAGDAFIPDVSDFCQFIDECIKNGKTLEELRDLAAKDNKKRNYLTKIDGYYQCLPNIKMITRDIIRQYKEQLKKEKIGGTAND